jgi:kynurenine formamidase
MLKKKHLLFAPILLLFLAGCAQKQDSLSVFKTGKWIDLSYAFDEQSVYWPTNIPFTHDTVFEGMNDKGYYYASFKYSAEEHGGTHFDAPMHFAKGGNSIEKVAVEQLVGEGVVIDVREKAGKNRDYLVGIEDFRDWEKQYGTIPEKAIILINTGFAQYYPDKLTYTGTLLTGKEGVEQLHFPGLDPEAAKFLAEQRKINAIGLDTPSIDYGQSKDFMAHRTLCANNITAYENITNIDKLPARGFWIMAFPMKIKGGSGAPLRIVAFIPEKS